MKHPVSSVRRCSVTNRGPTRCGTRGRASKASAPIIPAVLEVTLPPWSHSGVRPCLSVYSVSSLSHSKRLWSAVTVEARVPGEGLGGLLSCPSPRELLSCLPVGDHTGDLEGHGGSWRTELSKGLPQGQWVICPWRLHWASSVEWLNR